MNLRLLLAANTPYFHRRFLLPLANHFRGLGWTVDGAGPKLPACPICRERYDRCVDIPWSRNPLALGPLLNAPRALRSAVDERRYDIVHFHTPVPAFLGRWTLRRHRARGATTVAYTAHGFHFHSYGTMAANRIFFELEALASGWTDALVVINDEDQRAAVRLMDLERIHVMPGIGVDTHHFHPDLRRPNRETPTFLMIAEHRPGKRHRDLLRAFSMLERPETRLCLAGEGTDAPAFRAAIKGLGLDSRVRTLGFQEDVRPLLAEATALLLPSQREGLSRAVMEGLSCAVPVIGSDARGVAELLLPDRGTVVPLGDAAGLAAAMAAVLDRPEEALAMAARGRTAMVQGHDITRILSLHETLYEGLLRNRDRR